MRYLLLVFSTITLLFSSEDEFVVGNISSFETSKYSYFNSLNMPNVYVGTQCKDKCSGSGCCWSVIRNQSGKTIRTFSSKDSVGTIASGRYEDIAYLLYSRTYGSGKNRKTKYYLVDHKNREYDVPSGSTGMTNIITKDRELVSIKSDGVYKNGVKVLSSDTIEVASISNNPQGDIAAIAVLDLSDEVIVTDLTKWINTNILLSVTGDKDGVLSVYPKNKKELYASVYKNVNIFNKGIVGSYVNFTNQEVREGWIFNSADRNIGFDPDMFLFEGNVYIGTQDSTNRKKVSVILSEHAYKTLDHKVPIHIDGFEYENVAELLVGVGLTQAYWRASSSIDGISNDSNMEYGEVKYDIGSSLYKSLYFEGRFNSTRLSVSYLQNKAEDVGGLTAKVSKIVNVLFDVNGLIGDSSSLRLKVTKGNINGISTFEDKKNGAESITTEPKDLKTEFESEVLTYGAYVMLERGYFGGLEYTNYTTPSAVGFSNSKKRIQYYGMDPNFEISTYSILFGYDEISYAKRYETNLSRFYLQGSGGIGWADYHLSSPIKKDVGSNGYSINKTDSLAFNAELEFGYIYQQRFRMFRGLGYSLTASYKARGSYNSSGQSEDSDNEIDSDELELEMTRYDIWHGPYISANIVF